MVAALPQGQGVMSETIEIDLDPSVPEPQRPMKGFHWTGKPATHLENKEVYNKCFFWLFC